MNRVEARASESAFKNFSFTISLSPVPKSFEVKEQHQYHFQYCKFGHHRVEKPKLSRQMKVHIQKSNYTCPVGSTTSHRAQKSYL